MSLRKPVTESWDEFFDLSAESTTLRPLRARLGTRNATSSTKPEHDFGQGKPGRASPTDSFSSWDDSPSPTPSVDEPRSTALKSPKTSAALHLALPRHSPSLAPALPSRSSQPCSPQEPSGLMISPFGLPSKQEQDRPKSATSNKSSSTKRLVKRHPSSSFIRPSLHDHSSSSLSSTSMLDGSNRAHSRKPSSRWNLFGEREKAHRAESPSMSRDELPSSSSQLSLERRPGFLRRLSSSYKISSNGLPREASEQQRRRSSSVGHPSSPTKSRLDQPPVPALPPNLRSASGISNTSSSSAASSMDAAVSRNISKPDPTRANPNLRRSASSLSRRSDRSPTNPPVSYMPVLGVSPYPSSLDSSVHLGQPATPNSPISSGSFSRGFHLPSPSPGSPYKSLNNPATFLPPLPHSNSFPIQYNRPSDTEEEVDAHATPKRKSKIRPVSALPAPLPLRQGWQPEGWAGPGQAPRLPSNQSDPDAQFSFPVPAASAYKPSSPRNTSFRANAASTFRRIGSMSMKHGRRISDGFKFGGKRSTSPSDERKEPQALETVTGSPSKPGRSPGREVTTSPVSQAIFPTVNPKGISSSDSALRADAPRKAEETSDIGPPLTDDNLRRKTKQKKTKSSPWLTEEQLATQHRLKAQKAAVKHFANEVRKLKSQVEGSNAMLQRVQDQGTVDEKKRLTDLAKEFEEVFQMADLLLDLNDIGSTPGSQLDASAYASTSRSRRVTLASEKAKAMSQTLDKLTLSHSKDVGTRSISLPEQDSAMGPPRPQLPETWRRSTGQPDTAERQHQLLLMMTQGGRPELRRGSTTPFAFSTRLLPSGSFPRIAESVKRPEVQSAFPGTSEAPVPALSAVGATVPASSMPTLDAPLSPPPATSKPRFSTKAGLTGLKELVRSLKATSSRKPRPPPVQTDIFSSSGLDNAHTLVSPISPSMTSSQHSKEVDHATGRSSFSAIPRDDTTSPRRSISSAKQGMKRPNVRRIFHRSTSGSWAGLAAESASAGSLPPVPMPPRRSVDSSSGRETSSVKGVRGLGRQASSRFTGGVVKPSKTPTSPKFGFLSSRKSSHGDSESSSTEGGGGLRDRADSTQHTPRRARNNNAAPALNGVERDGELDRTVRPTRKSRLFGLGMPSSPSSPSSPSWPAPRWPPSTQPQSTWSGMERTASDSTDWSLISGGTAATADTAATATTASSGFATTATALGPGPSRPIITLTPDTIPVLQEHVDFCVQKLNEWKSRAEALVPDI